jgi:hypothetical protein
VISFGSFLALVATRKLNNNSLSGVLPDSIASIDGFALVYALQSHFIVFFCLPYFSTDSLELASVIEIFRLTISVAHYPRFLQEPLCKFFFSF